jgi:hypothetical protein
MLLVGLALLNESERAAFFDQPWPRPQTSDGGHLLDEWRRSQHWRGAGQSDASITRTFIQKISAGNTAWWGARAVMRHDLAHALKQTPVPFVVLNPNDDLFEITPRVAELRPEITVLPITEYGFGLFEVIPAPLARLAQTYFDSGAVSPHPLTEGAADEP